jgi:transglutaminase-like putative cysteine protease
MTNSDENYDIYLAATEFIDCDNKDIIDYAKRAAANASSQVERAIKIFYAVRDEIYYDPYNVSISPHRLKASYTLARKKGYCVTKAILLAACGRAIGIPSRLGYADVKNHISTERLRKSMNSEVFYFHGFAEFYLNKNWVKATPAFNLSLCEKFQIKPLEFNGKDDALFHEYDKKGDRHMEYIRYRGHYADLPLSEIIEAYEKHYPKELFDDTMVSDGDFHDDAKPI